MSTEKLSGTNEVTTRRTKTPADLGLSDEPMVVGPEDSPTAHLRAKLDAQLRALLAHEPGTRSGADPEDLHQMRVAVRRMRSVLKLSEDPAAQHVRAELKLLGSVLGEVRDYDVLIDHLRTTVAGFGEQDLQAADQLIAAFAAQRDQAKRRLNQALNTARYTALLTAIGELTKTAEVANAPDDGRLDPATALRKPYRRLVRAAAALPNNPPDDELHAVRIRGKRLRYAAELAVPAAKKKQAARLKALVKATKRLQDVLGDHQDAVVAADRVRNLAVTSDERMVGFIAGRIVEREANRRAEARAAWPDALAGVNKLAARLLP
ncbi:CHAD domain-containing protein [Amycolatopsis taiwanensis]|uniref:CHAD domain-containing protein n=1 Tax=Amycolatopsis taiwanensis TaxID=342230 RepID=UPI0004B9E771